MKDCSAAVGVNVFSWLSEKGVMGAGVIQHSCRTTDTEAENLGPHTR